MKLNKESIISSSIRRLERLMKTEIINFIDCEYVSVGMPGAGRPNPKDVKTEIVQIGCVKYNMFKREEIASLSVIIKPTDINKNSADYEWFYNFTGLTDEKLAAGTNLTDGVNQLATFINSETVVVMKGDPEVIYYDTLVRDKTVWDITETNPVFRLKPNIRPFYNIIGVCYEINKNRCSGELHELTPNKMNSSDEMNTHNALWDARSMAIFMSYVFLQTQTYKFIL